MTQLQLPVRYYRDYAPAYDYSYEALELPLAETAFLVVDVDGGQPNPVTECFIAPALAAARDAGMLVTYVHNDLRLVADPGNIVGEVWGRTKRGAPDGLAGWRKNRAGDWRPTYLECVAPRPAEMNFPKWIWSGFHDTFLDQHLRSHGIRTLVVVGYSQRACLHYTCAEAVGRNYRVILLRDCTKADEQPDTVDPSLPEGGWIGRITLRNFEHLIGYTSTMPEFVAACRTANEGVRG